MSTAGLQRGSIVVVDFSPTNPGAGIRPALIVQNDRDNARMMNTIVVQITSNLSRVHEETQLLVDTSHPDWRSSGLRRPSAVNCSSISAMKRDHIIRVIGTLSAQTMQHVSTCLKAVLALN